MNSFVVLQRNKRPFFQTSSCVCTTRQRYNGKSV